MTADPLTRDALELLLRGHRLYGADRTDPGLPGPPQRSAEHADRLARLAASPGMGSTAARSGALAAELQRATTADAELVRLLNAAHADHAVGRRRSKAVLDDAYADRMPATDTAIGSREAARRMLSRLRSQHRQIRTSRRQSRLLARRTRRLTYRQRNSVAAQTIPLKMVQYHRSAAAGHVGQRIAAALDRLGVHDRQARRNWLRGYATLIARESGGRPSAVASQPATAPGPIQPDGYGLGYARGLTQTIPTTFAQYHQPGTSANIYDPIANICASMNYVMRRYGVSPDGSNLVELVQQADPRRSPRGY